MSFIHHNCTEFCLSLTLNHRCTTYIIIQIQRTKKRDKMDIVIFHKCIYFTLKGGCIVSIVYHSTELQRFSGSREMKTPIVSHPRPSQPVYIPTTGIFY